MGRIAITDGMAPDAVLMLENEGHEAVIKHYSEKELLEGVLMDFDAVIVRSATKLNSMIIEKSASEEKGIKIIGRAGVGVDNIDLEAAKNAGVMVYNTPGASTRSVVELTMGHLISSARMIVHADRSLRGGMWEKSRFLGSEIGGKRLGLIGFGRIARGVADVARSMGMEIHAYDPYLDSDSIGNNECVLHADVDDLFKKCTHISVHCNLTDETRHLVNSTRINMMPTVGADGIECGNHIVSCARGGIVDESAAVEALDSGKLTSLALDVFENEPIKNLELLTNDGFHGTPHIAASTKEAQDRVGKEIAGILIRYFDGELDISASLNQ